MSKLKLALYWGASCGGCDVAVLDTNEKILDVAAAADILFWPVAMDFKYRDVEALEDRSVDVCLFNGAIRNSDQERVARLLREKSKVIVAFGSCSCFGGIPGLANVSDRNGVFQMAYLETSSTVNDEKTLPQVSIQMPEGEVTLPEFYDTVFPLNSFVDVDYYIPGCPPPVDLILSAIDAIVSGKLPPKGATLAPDKALCYDCPLEKSSEKSIKHFRRPFEFIPDPKKCLLEQGLVCLGPATRAGCGARCIKANMPCRGCFGPPSMVEDQGAKILGAIASIIDSEDPKEILQVVNEVKDPLGTFYRFTLPASTLRRVRKR